MDKNWKSIKYNDNWRTNQLDLLKDISQQKKLLGLIPQKTIVHIPVFAVGNKQLFLKIITLYHNITLKK